MAMENFPADSSYEITADSGPLGQRELAARALSERVGVIDYGAIPSGKHWLSYGISFRGGMWVLETERTLTAAMAHGAAARLASRVLSRGQRHRSLSGARLALARMNASGNHARRRA